MNAAIASNLPPPPLPQAQQPWALLCDIDGTLLDFAPRPYLVQVDAPLLHCLHALQQGLNGALALISGRSAADMAALFAPLALECIGLHGLEQRHADGRLQHWHVSDEATLQRLHTVAEAIAAALPGVYLEAKGPTMALHCREAPQHAQALHAACSAALTQLPGYALLEGYDICELRPLGSDKGEALRRLLHEPAFAGRLPIFIGDDYTDAPALAAAREAGGMAIAAGARVAAQATHRLDGPAAVRAWLDAWAQKLAQRART